MRLVNLAALLLGSSVFMALIGPFGTYFAGGFWLRLIYWSGLVASSAALACAVVTLAKKLENLHSVAREVLSLAVFTLVFSPIVLLWTTLFFADEIPDYFTFSYVAIRVAAISASISLVRTGARILFENQSVDPPQDSPSAGEVGPRLLKRLPDGHGTTVLRLSAQDHRVQVVTDEGAFDLRMRLSDAISEMDTVDGFSPHRSHWVARDAIARVERYGPKMTLHLHNGDKVPVSRNLRPDLEDAGLI